MPKDAKEILKKATYFMYPGISRGPARDDWMEIMREIAEVLQWPDCPYCYNGIKDNGDLCGSCLGTGKLDNDTR